MGSIVSEVIGKLNDEKARLEDLNATDERSREISLAITKIEEATFWLAHDEELKASRP